MGKANLRADYSFNAHRGFERKFPMAAILNEVGVPTGQFILPNEYKEATHKGHIGCPECYAPLDGILLKKNVLGNSIQRGAYFRSRSLEGHKDCDLASSEDVRLKNGESRLAFFNKEGPKLIYWNFTFPFSLPIYSQQFSSPLKKSYNSGHWTGKQSDDVATYSVHSMKDFLKLAKYRDFTDPFYNDVYVYNRGHRIPWRYIMMGANQEKLARQAFFESSHHFSQPKIALVFIRPTGNTFPDKVGAYKIQCNESEIFDKRDPSGLKKIKITPIIITNNREVFDKLKDGGNFFINCLSSLYKGRHCDAADFFDKPSKEIDNNLVIHLRVSTLDDITDCQKYLESSQPEKKGTQQALTA